MAERLSIKLDGLRFPNAVEVWQKNYEFLVEQDPQLAWNYAARSYGTAYFRGAVEALVGDPAVGTRLYSAFCSPSLTRLIGWDIGEAAYDRCSVNDAARTMAYVVRSPSQGGKGLKSRTIKVALPF